MAKIVEDYLFSKHEMQEEEIRTKKHLQNAVSLRKNGFTETEQKNMEEIALDEK